jgi:hypothetical protein
LFTPVTSIPNIQHKAPEAAGKVIQRKKEEGILDAMDREERDRARRAPKIGD